MKVLLIGSAGFIAFHIAERLLKRGDTVLGVDNLNDYYDTKLKHARLAILKSYANFSFVEADIANAKTLFDIFNVFKPDRVINLAAQVGVRYSLTNPDVYTQSNLVGFSNVLECCRFHDVQHLVHASSSSVYGANTKVPFSVHDSCEHPVSYYAATKKANELMAHSYSYLYQIPITCLRYFTVYGPWGRPDMSPWLFTKAILKGEPIKVFNHGKMNRDYSYVGDIADATILAMDKKAVSDERFDTQNPDPAISNAPYKVYNIGNHQPIQLIDFISTLETILGVEANKDLQNMQPGDVVSTFAEIETTQNDLNFIPKTDLKAGLTHWVDWYNAYHAS
jgi:UDP-glucuronate 4-epimerase